MTVLVLFKQFSGKFCLFLAPNFECFPKYDAFCLQNFDFACLKRLRHTVIKRFEITEKFYSSKALLEMAGGGMHLPHPPGSAPVGVQDPGFDSRADQIGRNVANGSPPLRCFFGVVLPKR